MGACNIEFELPGTPNFSAIEKAFKERQEQDRAENGHQAGYSGDFQTVRKVIDSTHRTFDTYEQAEKYCLENAEKWTSVVAVRFKALKGKLEPSSKLVKLQTLCKALSKQIAELQRLPVALKPFEVCGVCKSKVNTVHVRGVGCPVCGEGSFRPKALQNKITKLQGKLKSAQDEHRVQREQDLARAMQKNGTVATLVCGWGAC